MKKIQFLIFLLLLSGWSGGYVYAERIGIAVDQTSIAFDANSEEQHDFVVKVTNVSDKKQEVFVGAIDYHVGDNNELSLKSEFDEQDGVKDWIKAKQAKITLEPSQSQDVNFSFLAPPSAPVGSHRGAVVFRAMPEGNEKMSVQGQIAVHTLINIKGNTHAGGRIESFNVPLFALGEVEYMAVFANAGNIHYVPYGELSVKNVFTKKERVHKFDKHFVFPDRTYTFVYKEGIPSIFGLYRAKVSFVDGESVVRTRNDYVMGVAFPLVMIVFLAIIWWVVKKTQKFKKTNQNKRLERNMKNRQKIQFGALDENGEDEK